MAGVGFCCHSVDSHSLLLQCVSCAVILLILVRLNRWKMKLLMVMLYHKQSLCPGKHLTGYERNKHKVMATTESVSDFDVDVSGMPLVTTDMYLFRLLGAAHSPVA